MYRIIRHLSIDVSIGAAVMMGLVATSFGIKIEGVYYFLLALITWLIYTADHLMDARNIKHVAGTPRHRFHQKHYRGILTAEIIGIFLFVALIPRDLELDLFRLSLLLAGLILLYFLSLIWARKTQFRWVLKELFIALCYTLGVSLIPVYRHWPPGLFDWIFLIRILFLALCNLFLFSWMESGSDMQDRNPSAIRFMGARPLQVLLRFFLWLNLAAGLLILVFIPVQSWLFSLTLSLMNLVLLAVTYRPHRFRKNELYRVLGDGIFLLPLLSILWHLMQHR